MVGSVLRLRVLRFVFIIVIFDPGMLVLLTGCGDMVNMNVESPNEVEFLTQDLLACTKL